MCIDDTIKEYARNPMKKSTLTVCLLALAAVCPSDSSLHADDYVLERERARRELAPYFRKQVVIQSALQRSTGPEWSEELFKKKLFGCPSQPAAPVEPTKDLSFTTAGPGQWVGAVDGINIAITAPDGTQGGSVAVPTNSTARLPGQMKGPEYEFFFDGTINVRRALIDAAAAEFDRCFSRLPPGSYTSEELQRLCPYRPVSRAEQKQTCVITTAGTIGAPLADGSGFDLRLTESTVCDFIGYGRSGDTNTGFTTCFYNEYEGVATISSEILPATAQQKQLRTAKRRMAKVCAKTTAGRRMRPSQVKACVMREMAKVMAKA
jgi:hypothetical protein